MKRKITFTSALFFLITLCNAQKAVSFDVAAIHSIHHNLNGLNLSSFYHFNNHISCGIEINRFFAATKVYNEKDEVFKISAWDADLNLHYQFNLAHHWMFYPITGISHTAEKEINLAVENDEWLERFWSYNAGAGLAWHKGKWAPHAEYLFTWGHLNQQFILAGLSYEIEVTHKHKTHVIKE